MNLNWLFPPTCLSCREEVVQFGLLCFTCWGKIEKITKPFCHQCGIPFEIEVSPLCLSCLHKPPLFTQARSALVYNDLSKQLILKFKHNDQIHLASPLSSFMKEPLKDLIKDLDFLVPVPLHWLRLLKRQYNQAELLAKKLSIWNKIPLLSHILKRKKHTPSQGTLSRSKRLTNVQNAFYIPLKKQTFIAKKKLLLIDDVWTTGATIHACCKTLLKYGAEEVRVLTLARVVSTKVYNI